MVVDQNLLISSAFPLVGGVKKLITNTLSGCSKAVVSGSAKEEIDTIIEEIFGIDAFDVIINGDKFEGKGNLALTTSD